MVHVFYDESGLYIHSIMQELNFVLDFYFYQ